MGEKNFKYSDKGEQIKRANHFLITSYDIFYVCVSLITLVACVRGFREVWFTILVVASALVEMATTHFMLVKNRMDGRIKYVELIGLVILTWLSALAFHGYYVRFLAVIPGIYCIVFFDKKYTAIFSSTTSVLNILLIIYKVCIKNTYQGEEILDNLCATFAICVLLITIYIVQMIVSVFFEHMMGRTLAEKDAQNEMLGSIMHVADQVYSGTENAMVIMNELNSSSEMVSSAMHDISSSSQNTAENIQSQTVMTQNIQQSITETLKRSDNMVHVAKTSEQMNQESLETMNQLKSQSTVINNTNNEVATSMRELQSRTEDVKSIADTIFAISNQTNLLALNASIESARAGEAGKGFAVVADQIRQLAEKTRMETENIASILAELTEKAELAVVNVEKSVEAVSIQDSMIEQASSSIMTMNQNVNQLMTEINEIDVMLNDLSESNNEIVENIMQISATTEEVTASSIQAAELSKRNLAHSDETKELLQNVLTVSQELEKYNK